MQTNNVLIQATSFLITILVVGFSVENNSQYNRISQIRKIQMQRGCPRELGR